MWSWNGDKAPAKPPGEGCQIFESLSIATSDVLTITATDKSIHVDPRRFVLLKMQENSASAAAAGAELEEYILRWNDHGVSFFKLAENLLQQELLTDVTIWCGDRVFDAHR